jgi:hypothetical protein
VTEHSGAPLGESRTVFPFDLILVWPLRLDSVPANGIGLHLERAGWTTVQDTLRRDGGPEHDGFAFAEMVTFHPFVRRLLFGKAGERAFQLYRYKTGPDAKLEVGDNHPVDRLQVRDIRIYDVSKEGLFVVVTELTATSQTTWDRALNAVSYLRTLHFQHYYYSADGGAWIGGGAPRQVRLASFGTCEASEPDRASEMRQSLDAGRPALLLHWQELLKPVLDSGAKIHDLGDYRMGVMALLGTGEPQNLSEDDWFRLVEADGAGFMPYAPSFRSDRLSRAVYDRWWNSTETHHHRYLVGPMTFATVMQCRSGSVPRWLLDFRERWRRQYFDLFLLAHLQKALLLILQDRVAQAASGLRHEETSRIEKDMAQFASKYWFTELSPQIQQQELFCQVRRQLGLESLYRGVIEDKRLLADWASRDNERTFNRLYVPAGVLLALASITSVPLAKVLGLLGWRIHPATSSWPPEFTELIALVGSLALFFLALRYIYRRYYRKKSR